MMTALPQRLLPAIPFLVVCVIPSFLLAQTAAPEAPPAGAFQVSPRAKIVRSTELPPPTTDTTAARILNLHTQATGGAQAWRELRALRFAGNWSEGRFERSFSLLLTPDSLRMESSHRSLDWDFLIVTASDKGDFWRRQLKPQLGPTEDLADAPPAAVVLDPAFPWLLANWQASPYVFTFLSEATVAGQRAFHVQARPTTTGSKVDFYFDQKSFHLLLIQRVDLVDNVPQQVDCFPLGLRKSNNLWLPTGYDFRHDGRSYRRVVFTEATPNPEVPADAFAKPSTPTP